MKHEAVRIGVIGGSGLYQMPELKVKEELKVETPFGTPSDALIIGEIHDVPVVFLPRHGRGHRFTPSEVPYRANIYALKQMGVEEIISVSACGSLREEFQPGDVVIPDQLFDLTRERPRTFFGHGLVAHVSVAEPFCPTLSVLLADAVDQAGGTVHRGGRQITVEGPRFSTRCESEIYRSWGLDLIGMTTSPEAYLAREAGICYAVMTHVTDYDSWHKEKESVTVEMVIRRMQNNLRLAQQAIALAVARLTETETGAGCNCHQSLKDAIMTDPHKIPPEIREKLRAITGPYLE